MPPLQRYRRPPCQRVSDDARASRSRNGPPRPRARSWRARRSSRSSCAAPDLRAPFPPRLCRPPEGPHGHGARPPRQISCSPTSTTATSWSCTSACRARSASRPTAGHGADRHATITPRGKLRAHDHVVFHMSIGRADRLQRSAPLRPHGPRRQRTASTTSTALRRASASSRSATRLRRRDARPAVRRPRRRRSRRC